jgi:hypothetical protein
MTALAVNRVIGRFGEDENVSNPIVAYGVAAAAKLYAGAQVALNAAGYLVPAGTAGANKVVGVSRRLVDNTAGIAGALTAEVEVGVFPMNIGAGVDALTIANLYQPVFAIDDNTVGATDGSASRAFAGILVGFNAQGQALVQYQPQELVATYFPYTWQKTAADGAAGTATAEFPFFCIPFACKVANLKIVVGGAGLTQDPNNYATIILNKRTAGGAAVPVASATTQSGQTNSTGTWVAWTNVYTPQAGIVATFAQNDEATLQITKSGTGVVVPICTIEVDILPA